MKTQALLAASIISSLSTMATARTSDPQGYLTEVNVREIFVPNGFDNNDDVVMVLDGELPNSCYRVVSTKVLFDDATKTYQAIQIARRFNSVCIPDPTPFWTEVHVGLVEAGTFTVKSIGAANETLGVKVSASSNPDDFLYAPVESARTERDDATGLFSGYLTGRIMNSCMELQEIRVQDSGKTIEVLPIMKMALRSDCQQTEQSFNWKFDLPSGMATGRHLLHVRSLSGKAVNYMFSVEPNN